MARSEDTTGSESSRKVAKAAKAGKTSVSKSGKEGRELGFPAAVAAVIVLGVSIVAIAWNERDVDALTPSFSDHWHAAYGIYDCRTEEFQAALPDPQTPNSGIHSHGDGVAHIHPRSSEATGKGAVLERLLDAMDAEIRNDEEMVFRNRDALTEVGAECDGEPAILQTVRFAPGETTPTEIRTEDLDQIRFRADQDSIVIALAPEGADIPLPPQEFRDTARNASPTATITDGLSSIVVPEGVTPSGFDSDGFLLDQNGERVQNEDGEFITTDDVAEDAEGDGDADQSEDTSTTAVPEADETEADDTSDATDDAETGADDSNAEDGDAPEETEG